MARMDGPQASGGRTWRERTLVNAWRGGNDADGDGKTMREGPSERRLWQE